MKKLIVPLFTSSSLLLSNSILANTPSRTELLLNAKSTEIFSVTPYEQNYLMETYSNGKFAYPKNMKHNEVKFQLSFAVPLWRGVLGEHSVLAAAYTQTSWWQMLNQQHSAPFRETNYQPQLFFAFQTDKPLFWGWQLKDLETGIIHQSNGRDNNEFKSRSWNRFYTLLTLEKEAWQIQLKPWWRLPEHQQDDDNPDIHRYLGYGDISINYRTHTHQFHLKGHYVPSSGKGGILFSYSYPITKYLRLYGQYFSGYGESLIDYDRNIQRIGVGVSLNNIF